MNNSDVTFRRIKGKIVPIKTNKTHYGKAIIGGLALGAIGVFGAKVGLKKIASFRLKTLLQKPLFPSYKNIGKTWSKPSYSKIGNSWKKPSYDKI